MPPPPPYSPPPFSPPAGQGPQTGGAFYLPRQAPYATGSSAVYGPPHRSGWMWAAIAITVFGLILLGMVVAISSAIKTVVAGAEWDGAAAGKDSIAVIDISGVITDPETIDKQLEKYGDSGVKAIILHIDSPGGGAAASQEIYHQVLRIRQQKHKKIVASVESLGASGAYYIASACDRIYANPASVVGSVGVIMEWTNYGDLLHWAKLKHVTITRGDLKDAGDPARDLTPQEQAYFQSLVDNMYGQFVHDVAFGRHTSVDKIAPLATGQVWTGEQAQSLGLIDEQGGYNVALTETARSVGIQGTPNVIKAAKEKHGLLGILSDGADNLFPNPSHLLDRSPGFYFLWK